MVQLKNFEPKNASFLVGLALAIAAALFNVVSFVTPFWLVARPQFDNQFRRLGLWEVCFHNFIFPEDYISKAYDGCWYIYYPEYRYIRYWLNPPWLYAVQMLSILDIICNLAVPLILAMKLIDKVDYKDRKTNIISIILLIIAICCFTIITILMGVMSKDREWMPQPDHNQLSWSFAFAVVAGFFSVFAAMALVTNYTALHSQEIEESAETEGLLKSGIGAGGSLFGGTNLPPGSAGFDAFNNPGMAGTDSRLGGVPSLFTVPPSALYQHPGMGGAPSAFSHTTSQVGAGDPGLGGVVGTMGTSAATVSAKLREQLDAARQAKMAAMAGAPTPSAGYQPATPGVAIAMPGGPGAMHLQHPQSMSPSGPYAQLPGSGTMQRGGLGQPGSGVYGSKPQLNVAMDTTV